MQRDELKTYLAFTKYLAALSDKAIAPFFRRPLSVEQKADQSPVTQADRLAEQVMRAAIKERYPHHGIMGEEFGNEQEHADWCWLLDPIDGTVSFIAGRPIFGTLIALCYQGVPIIGAISQPISGELWLACTAPAYPYAKFTQQVHEQALKTREYVTLADTVLATTGPQYFTQPQQAAFDQISDKAKRILYGGDCYNYGLLALGQIDLVVEAGLKPHDFVALSPIITAAGGICTDWQGQPITLTSNGSIIAAANAALHQEVLPLL